MKRSEMIRLIADTIGKMELLSDISLEYANSRKMIAEVALDAAEKSGMKPPKQADCYAIPEVNLKGNFEWESE